MIRPRAAPSVLDRTRRGGRWWSAIGLLPLAIVILAPFEVGAQSADPPVGSTVRVVDTGGRGLNLRNGPGLSAPVALSVDEGTTLQVLGPARPADGFRWIELREPGGMVGWAAVDFLLVVSGPSSTPTPTPTRVVAAPSAPTATSTPTLEPTQGPELTATPTPTNGLEIEARVKVPETADKDQTLTVTVYRNGAPAPDIQVVAVVQNTDPPIIRDMEPTDSNGRTVRSFVVRDKGTIVIVVIAVAPDGTKGHQTVSYFRR
ncbi:MAG TPA: SH3 domain-containing protein [Chloroflexota bacterium]|nr:SH3 domain-containing protein [Chloroflexota bacterium]